MVGADASHAWVSLYCGTAGWIDFDPTNNVIPALDHITIAWGRDYSDVCPVQGVYMGGGVSRLKVEVDVMPQDEFIN
jgi:transglutaminase-like putative cysteine protease